MSREEGRESFSGASSGPYGPGLLPVRGSQTPERAQLTHSVPQVIHSRRPGTPSGSHAGRAQGSTQEPAKPARSGMPRPVCKTRNILDGDVATGKIGAGRRWPPPVDAPQRSAARFSGYRNGASAAFTQGEPSVARSNDILLCTAEALLIVALGAPAGLAGESAKGTAPAPCRARTGRETGEDRQRRGPPPGLPGVGPRTPASRASAARAPPLS